MAKICPICEEKIRFMDAEYLTQGLVIHTKCRQTFVNNPEKYGAVPEKLTSAEKRYLTKQPQDKTPSKEDIPVKTDNNKEVILADIDIPFGSILWVSFQFFIAGIIIAVPIWLFFLLLVAKS